MKTPIILGIALCMIAYQLAIVIPWLISNNVVPLSVDLALAIVNFAVLYYISFRLFKFYLIKITEWYKNLSK